MDVIIPAYGSHDLTHQCIAAVRATAPDARIIVVDNASGIEPDADVLVSLPVNVGFAKACNLGARLASGHLVFLNNDTIPTPGWLDPLCVPGWIAQPRLAYPDGTIQCAGVDLGVRDGILTAWNLLEDRPGGPVPAVTGACLSISAEDFATVGGFDERYWNGYEDVDLCLRAATRGICCWYEPSSTVVHLESRSGPERWTRVRENVALLNDLWMGEWHRTTC